MTIAAWLEMAQADAERRGLGELHRMLEALARSIEIVRAADWNEHEARTASAPGGLADDEAGSRQRPSGAPGGGQ